MKAEERAVSLDENIIRLERFFGAEGEAVQARPMRLSLHTILGVIVKALFLLAWGYGLFQGGLLGLFCVACGIIVLAVTTFTR